MPGVDLDHRRPGCVGRIELGEVGVDEEGNTDTGVCQPRTGILQPRHLAGHVEPPLGGQFLAFFRNQADVPRFRRDGDCEHLLGDCHFEVHLGLQHLAQDRHIGILDVAAVFPEMQGDRIGARGLGHQRGLDRARVAGLACLTQGGDMVDVDAEMDAHCVSSVSSRNSWRV